MNCTEYSRACKEQLIVVLLLLRAAEAALTPNKGLTVHRMSLPSDIIILLWVYTGLQCETPTSGGEKVSLQRRNRVTSGFTMDKGWNEKSLQ